MKKLIIVIFTLFVVQLIQAQSDVNVIYIDLNNLNYEEEYIGENDLKLGNSSTNNRNISFYFISDLSTFCNYEMHKYLINNMMLVYNLRDKNDIFSNCQINYFLKNNSDKNCADEISSKKINLTTF